MLVSRQVLDSVGNPEDMAKYMVFGCCCCACTLCLSWCPLWCKMRSIAKKMEKKAGGPLKESSLGINERAIKTRLLTGPEATPPSPQAMARSLSGKV